MLRGQAQRLSSGRLLHRAQHGLSLLSRRDRTSNDMGGIVTLDAKLRLSPDANGQALAYVYSRLTAEATAVAPRRFSSKEAFCESD